MRNWRGMLLRIRPEGRTSQGFTGVKRQCRAEGSRVSPPEVLGSNRYQIWSNRGMITALKEYMVFNDCHGETIS